MILSVTAANLIGKIAESKNLTAVTRIAILIVAANSQIISAKQDDITFQISGLTQSVVTDTQRITRLEKIIDFAYDETIKINPPKPPKGTQHGHPYQH